MPTYDYHCEANGRTVEVQHRMAETVSTWGEVCALTGLALGDTPADTPVTKLVTGGNVITKGSLGSGSDIPPCASGGCGGGMCGLG